MSEQNKQETETLWSEIEADEFEFLLEDEVVVRVESTAGSVEFLTESGIRLRVRASAARNAVEDTMYGPPYLVCEREAL